MDLLISFRGRERVYSILYPILMLESFIIFNLWKLVCLAIKLNLDYWNFVVNVNKLLSFYVLFILYKFICTLIHSKQHRNGMMILVGSQ